MQVPQKADEASLPVTLAERAAVAALAVLAFAVRMIPWEKAVVGWDFRFCQADAFYHVRRVSMFLHSFPGVPGVDSYLSYPYGAECPWPPLYDILQAGLAVLAGGLHPSDAAIRGVNSLLPPVLAALTVFPVHRIARRLYGRGAALVAAALFVALPIHLQLSVIGSGDHHAAEVLLLAAFLAAFLGRPGPSDGRGGRRAGLLAGAILAASVLVWQGSVVFAGILIAGVSVLAVAASAGKEGEPRRREASDAVDRALVALATATAIAAGFRAIYPSASEQTVFDFGFFSWFQPAVLLFGTVALLIMRRLGRTGAGPARRNLAWSALAIGLAIALPLAVPAWRDNLRAALGFLGAADPWLATINEFKPLNWSIVLHGWDSIETYGPRIYHLLALLAVGAAAAEFARARRRGEPLRDRAILLACAAILGVLAAIQRRWANANSINIALAGGWIAARALGAARERLGAARRTGGWKRLLGPAAGVVTGAVLFAPSAFLLHALWVDTDAVVAYHSYPPLRWLRDNTPPTSGLWGKGGKRPEYSVLAPWSYGHLVLCLGERPTVVGNFGVQLRGNGIADLTRFYHAADEDAVASIFDRRGIRYLVLPDPLSEIVSMSPVIGIDFDNVYTDLVVDSHGTPRRRINERYLALPAIALYGFDGALSPFGRAMTRFRLLHESQITNPMTGDAEAMKIFEYVKGARLRGRARPGAEVTFSIRLRTDAGRRLVYVSKARAGADGWYSVPFPYATRGTPGGTVAESRPAAATASGSVEFDVSETDVLEGRVVTLPRLP